MTRFYFAPLEGITGYIFRNAFQHYYGGVDKYFTPFITSAAMSTREKNDVVFENNKDVTVVPQVLTNRVDEFLAMAKHLSSYGYDTVNLNLGCPSGTVVAKKRGSGFLSAPDDLGRFLDAIFEKSATKISLKTRIGIAEPSEWERILSIYQKYPMEELIIHPRVQKEFYKGAPHLDAFALAKEMLPNILLCYNGDITSMESYTRVMDTVSPECIMLGRGLIAKPQLLASLRGKTTSDDAFDLETFRKFHDEICAGYTDCMSGDTPVLYKMKELWGYWIANFPGQEETLKKIRKAKKLSEYHALVNALMLDL